MSLQTMTDAVQVSHSADGHDVVVFGRLDVRSVPDVRDAVHALIATGTGELRLHLDHCEIADATGLGVIVHLHRRASRLERRFTVVGGTDRTLRLLRACRLQRILVPA